MGLFYQGFQSPKRNQKGSTATLSFGEISPSSPFRGTPLGEKLLLKAPMLRQASGDASEIRSQEGDLGAGVGWEGSETEEAA